MFPKNCKDFPPKAKFQRMRLPNSTFLPCIGRMIEYGIDEGSWKCCSYLQHWLQCFTKSLHRTKIQNKEQGTY